MGRDINQAISRSPLGLVHGGHDASSTCSTRTCSIRCILNGRRNNRRRTTPPKEIVKYRYCPYPMTIIRRPARHRAAIKRAYNVEAIIQASCLNAVTASISASRSALQALCSIEYAKSVNALAQSRWAPGNELKISRCVNIASRYSPPVVG
jgi:hypothetical protein